MEYEFLNRSVWIIDVVSTDITTRGQSEPESNGNQDLQS